MLNWASKIKNENSSDLWSILQNKTNCHTMCKAQPYWREHDSKFLLFIMAISNLLMRDCKTHISKALHKTIEVHSRKNLMFCFLAKFTDYQQHKIFVKDSFHAKSTKALRTFFTHILLIF